MASAGKKVKAARAAAAMPSVSSEPLADMRTYEDLAKGWETDRVLSAHRSTRAAWIVAGVSVILSLALGVAIMLLTPLHRIEPFVVRVDKTTGAVEAVSKLNETSRTETEAVNKYMVGKYVRAREEYSRDLAPVNYKTVALMSAAPVGQSYFEWFKPENPQSPLKLYGATAHVTIRILNVSFLAPNIASVRYEQSIRGVDGVKKSNWTATVTFRYSSAPMTEEDRLVNPIGFEVTDYRNDPEVGGTR